MTNDKPITETDAMASTIRTQSLTDTAGVTSRFSVEFQQRGPGDCGWWVIGDGIRQFVPSTSATFPTFANIVARASELTS